MPLFGRKKSGSIEKDVPFVMKTKRYKGKASKEKLLKVNNEYITDDKDKPVIKLVNIKQIGFGKQSEAFSSNSKVNHIENKCFLTIYSKRANNVIDLQISNPNDRPKFVDILLHKLKKVKKAINKSDSEKVETLKDNTDQIFLIDIQDENSIKNEQKKHGNNKNDNENEHENEHKNEDEVKNGEPIDDEDKTDENKNEFKLKRHKEKGSKQKTVRFSDNALVDDHDKIIIKYKHIDKIIVGKETKVLKENKHASKKSHAMFFSFIDSKKETTIDFQVLDEKDRFHIISKMLHKLESQDLIPMVQNYIGKDESLVIDLNNKMPMTKPDISNVDMSNKDALPESKEELHEFDDNKMKWQFKRYKEKGFKKKAIELRDDAIVCQKGKMKSDEKLKLDDLQCIILGKATAALTNSQNTKLKEQSNEKFISFKFRKDIILDLEEINKYDRLDLLFKVINNLKQLQQPKKIENLVNNDIFYQIKDKIVEYHVIDDETQTNPIQTQQNENEDKNDTLQQENNDMNELETINEAENVMIVEQHNKDIAIETQIAQIDDEPFQNNNNELSQRQGNNVNVNIDEIIRKENEKQEKRIKEIENSYHEEINKLKNEYALLQQEYNDYKDVVELNNKDTTKDDDELNASLQKERENNKKLQKDYDAQLAVNVEVNKQLSKLLEDQKDLKNENKSMKKELDKLREQNENDKDKINKLQKQLDGTNNKKNKDKIQKELKTEIESMKRQMLADKQEIERLKQELEISKERQKNQRKSMIKVHEKKEQELVIELESIKRQSVTDKQEIEQLKEELENSEKRQSNQRKSIVELEDKLKLANTASADNEEESKMKAIRCNYIDNVKAVLSKSDWSEFRKLMKFVATHSKKLKDLESDMEMYNQQRQSFLDKLVSSLMDIFAPYPKSKQHLMLDFQIIIPNESERFMFVKMMTESLHEMENNVGDNNKRQNNKDIFAEFNNKIKRMEQEVMQQTEINIMQSEQTDNGIVEDFKSAELHKFEDNEMVETVDECQMILHGITATYKMKLKLNSKHLMIGKNKFEYNDIYKIEIGDCSLFHGNVDQHNCLVLLTAQGTIQLEAPSQTVRDKWLRAIEYRPNNKKRRISIENWSIDLQISSPTYYAPNSDMNNKNEFSF